MSDAPLHCEAEAVARSRSLRRFRNVVLVGASVILIVVGFVLSTLTAYEMGYVDARSRMDAARVSELSLYGGYIDMPNPLPEGTSIAVRIYSGGRRLEASGKVVYAAPNLGIGVSFHEVSVQSLIVFKEWLLLAAQAKYHQSG